MKSTDHHYFHNIILERGDRVKVFFLNGADYYIGVVKERRDWFAHDKIFYYIETERVVKNGIIQPTDHTRPVCVPAWVGIIRKM